MMRNFAWLTFVVILSLTPHLQAAQCLDDTALARPKIGLALGGGGARGEAHIGVLKRLEELRVPIDFVAGTSIGSIIGGLVGAGVQAAEMEEIIGDIDWNSLFNDAPDRADRPFRRKRDDDFALFGPKLGIGKDASLLPSGAIAGQNILFLFESIVNQRTHVTNFDDLPVPFRAIATDIYTGDEVVIDSGSVAMAMRSSMAVPAVFSPVPYEDKLLVDGGIANNLPVSVVKEMGADIVIAVDVGAGLLAAEEVEGLLSITSQMTNLMVHRTTMAQEALLTDDDLLIRPALGDKVTSMDFAKMAEAIPIGYDAADQMTQRLSELSISPEAFARYRDQVDDCQTPLPIVHWVNIDNRTRFNDSIIEDRLNIKVGEPLDVQSLENDLEEIYGLGFLKFARFEVQERNGETGVSVIVLPDDRGTTLLEYGFDIFGDSNSSDINARVGLLKTDLDDRGSEVRAFLQLGEEQALYAELYKPLDNALRTILFPSVFWTQQDLVQFGADGAELNQFEIQQFGGELALGREFGRHAALSAGIRLFDGDVDVAIGNEAIGDFGFDGGEWFLRFDYDRLDDEYIPSDGTQIELEYLSSESGLGADDEYEQLTFGAFVARTWDRHNVLAGIRYNTTIDNNAPIYATFRAGGFASLSGLQFNEINGQHFGIGLLGYRLRLKEGGLVPGFIGGTVEYGNVAEDRADIFDNALFHGSLYLSYKTPMGPLYLGLGVGENDQQTYFLRMGNIFNNFELRR